MSAKRTIAVLTAALTLLVLTGCTNPALSRKLSDATSKMVASPPEGYKLSETSEPTCGIDYCDANFTYIFRSSSTESKAPFCASMIEWASKWGADSWFYDPEYIALPIEGHSGAALYSCFGGNQFSLAGTTKGVRWTVMGTPGQIVLSTIMNRDGNLDDDRMKPHTWDEGRALLFDGDRLQMDILSAIETYRTEHPNENPSSMETIKKATRALKLPSDIKFKKDKSGKVHYLNIPADDVMLEACINITPFDESYFGFPNPKVGFTQLYLMEGESVIDQFGYSANGKCK